MCKLNFSSNVFWEGNYSLYKLSLFLYILNVRALRGMGNSPNNQPQASEIPKVLHQGL